MVYSRVNRFAKTLNKQHRITNGNDIEKFWTNDLRSINETKQKIPNIFEKPFLKID